MKKLTNLALFLILFSITFGAQANNLVNGFGVGLSNQFANDIPGISIKFQKTPLFGVGAIAAFDSADTDGGYGAGLKFYRLIFAEPQLTFYMAGLLAMIGQKTNGKNDSGFQFDGTLGSEFCFSGLQSIGFSFEFGISINKMRDDFRFQTVGNHMVSAAVHFYL